MPVFVALYDYEPQNGDELAITEGDIISVTLQREDGWYAGQLQNGQMGLFPGNYVEAAPDQEFVLVNSKPVKPSSSGGSFGDQPTETSKAAGAAASSSSRPVVAVTAAALPTASKTAPTEKAAPAAQSSSAAAAPAAPRPPRLMLTYWSQNLIIMSAVFSIFCGISIIFWLNGDPYTADFVVGDIDGTEGGYWLAIYSMAVGVVAIPIECTVALKRPAECIENKLKFSFFGVVYVMASLPMFLGGPTAFSGFFMLFGGIVKIMQSCRQETGDDALVCGKHKQAETKKPTTTWDGEPLPNCRERAIMAMDDVRRNNEVGLYLILALYAMVNGALFAERFVGFYKIVRCSRNHLQDGLCEAIELTEEALLVCEPDCELDTPLSRQPPNNPITLSTWIAVAKAFGQLLNFNCALLILPVVRA
jgi:hypothetical protein